MPNPITITQKIIALLKQAGIDYSKMAGKIDPGKISQLITKTQKTATKPKMINALVDDKATFSDALKIFKDEAPYISQMNEMELVNFANNLEDYFKVGGKIKYRPSNVVTPEGTLVEGKKLENLAARKGAKETPGKVEGETLQGAMQGLMSLVDEMKGISPKLRNQMDRDELVKFIQKMRGEKFTNQEIKLVREYMDTYSIGLAKEKRAPAIKHAKTLGAKNKEEFEFVEEYLDNIQTTSPEKFREMYGNVKNVNMDINTAIEKKLEKHFRKKYNWDDAKGVDGGLDDVTFEKYDDELYQAQKEFGDLHTVYDTFSSPGAFGTRKSTSWANHPKNYLDDASERLQSITGEGLNVDFYKNYTDEVLGKYPKPEKFQYGGIAGMLGERTGYQTGLKVYPQASVRIGEQGLGNDFGLGSKDTTYGGAIIGEKDGLYGGIDYLKIKNKIDFMKENQTLFKDTTDDEKMNFIFGKKGKYGDIRLKTDKDLENAQISYNWKFAGGGLAPLLGEPTYADGGRTGFKKGTKFDPKRRGFLKLAAGLASIPFFGKFFKWAKPLAKTAKVADLTSIPIKNIDGMPAWFKPLVNKVIREGDDVTKKFATREREIVHQVSLEGKIGKDALGVEDVRVTQNLDEGTISVQYNSPNTIGESGVELLYKKGEEIPIKKKGKSTSVTEKDEFTAVEDDFYPQATSPDGDFDLEFTENIVNKVDDLYSDTSKLKEFATGKKLTIKEISESMKKKNILKEIEKNPNEHAFRNAPDYDPMDLVDDVDMASGGRVPMWLGGGIKSLSKGKEFIRQLVKKLAKDRGITGSYMMKVMNPKAFKKFVEDPANVRKWDPKTGIFATEKAKQLMKSTETARADQLERYLDMAKSSKEGDKNIQALIDAGIKSGMSRESAEKLAKGLREAIDVEDIIPRGVTDETILELEQMLKNLRTKDRKLNATGGRVPLAEGKKPGRKGNPLDWMELLNPDEDPDDLEEIIKYLKQSIREGLGRYNQGGRVPMFGGGAAKKLWQEFIERQFLKASNDIRQGKGLFKGLTQEQWIKQHDNLTKKLKEWEMGGKKSLPPGMKEYFGMNEIQLANKFKKAQTQVAGSADELSGIKKVKMTGDENLDYDWVETPGGWVKKPGSEGAFYRFGEKNKELIDKGVKNLRQETILREFDIKGKKPHASGGRVSLSAGGLAGMLGE